MKKKILDVLNEEHGGFAVTFEVLCTLCIMFSFFFLTVFLLMVMNAQRFMNTIMVSTAAEASRWGGTNSPAYVANVNSTPILQSAKQQINMVLPQELWHVNVTGGPSTIGRSGDNVWVRITYQLPSAYQSIGVVRGRNGQSVNMYEKLKNMQMQVSVKSIMHSGKLLG